MQKIWSDEFKELLLNRILDGLSDAGCGRAVKRNDFINSVSKPFKEYNTYINGKILEYLENSKIGGLDLQLLSVISTMIDEYWVYHHNLHFMLNIDDFDDVPNPDYSVLEKVPEDLDIILDISYKGTDFCCSMVHTDFWMLDKITGNKHNAWGIHLSRKSPVYGYKTSGVLYFPTFSTSKIFNSGISNTCLNCNRCSSCSNLELIFNDYIEEGTFNDKAKDIYIIPRAKQCNGVCIGAETGFTDLAFNDIVKYIVFALNQYFNRKVQRQDTIRKKRIPQVKVEFNEDISVSDFNKEFGTNYESHRFVTIRDSIRYERRHGSKHSHHSSPCTHYRRGTIRHYKNGKTVEIKGTMVNANKDNNTNVVYRVKE